MSTLSGFSGAATGVTKWDPNVGGLHPSLPTSNPTSGSGDTIVWNPKDPLNRTIEHLEAKNRENTWLIEHIHDAQRVTNENRRLNDQLFVLKAEAKSLRELLDAEKIKLASTSESERKLRELVGELTTENVELKITLQSIKQLV